MSEATHQMHTSLSWVGPFFWPGYGSPTVPAVSSVYLWTVESRHDEYPDGYFLYLAGETIDARYRHGQHTKSLRLGLWTIFDMEAMQHCERKEIWHVSDWKPHKKPGSPDEVKMIEAAGRRMMTDLRLFIAEIPDKRLSQRVEAVIIRACMTAQSHYAICQIAGCTLRRVTRARHRSR
ncbi:MAG: hypothetical protein J2P48_08770 [Alphaproteobacteria bacterium]|nr:hypothetical protein [Alphaproteobacteria bacterium]